MSCKNESQATRPARPVPRPDPSARFWRLPTVLAYTGRSRSSIYADPSFPRPIRIAPNTAAFRSAEVIAWCEAREAAARGAE
jgi:predicted DNA-binding transcriptional regulator AlpA